MVLDKHLMDPLKEYLEKTLPNVCDADPSALGNYIIALLERDQSPEDLKVSCTEKLEEFLTSETKAFVDKLFKYLASQSGGKEWGSENKEKSRRRSVSPRRSRSRSRSRSSSRERRRRKREKDTRGKNTNRERDRTRRERDRSRDRERERGRERDRRDKGMGSPRSGRRVREVTGLFDGDGGVPKFTITSKSGKGKDDDEHEDVDEEGQVGKTKRTVVKVGRAEITGLDDMDMPPWNNGPGMPMGGPRGGPMGRPPFMDRGGPPGGGMGMGRGPGPMGMQRPGGMIVRPGMPFRGPGGMGGGPRPPGMDMRGPPQGMLRHPGGPMPGGPGFMGHPGMGGPGGRMSGGGMGRPGMFEGPRGGPMGMGMRPGPGGMGAMVGGRTVVKRGGGGGTGKEDDGDAGNGGDDKPQAEASESYKNAPPPPMYNEQPGPRGRNPQQQRGPAVPSKSLYITCIPDELCSFSTLSSHFEKFGKLTNIHIKNERSAAVISFESVAQAKRAISSPDAVCGNRFIRVSWQRHLPGELGLQIPSGRPDGAKHAAAGSGSAGEQKGRGGPRGGAPPPFKKAKHEEHAGGPAGKRAGHVASSASKQLELEQMKRQLIQKQLAQQKMLLETLSQKKSTLSAEDKKSLMQKLSQLTKTIESSLKESSRVAVAQASAAREREAVAAEASKQKEEEEKKGEEMAKAALDSELEEIAAGEGAEGEEVTVVGEVDEQDNDEEDEDDDGDNWKR